MRELTVRGRAPSFLTRTKIEHVVASTLIAAKKKAQMNDALSLSFLSKEAMQKMNKKWRQINRPTDVLSFAPAVHMKGELGDLFFCTSYIRHEAKERAILFEEEMLRNLIHGVMHLVGYDHASLKDEKVMFGIQERVLTKLR